MSPFVKRSLGFAFILAIILMGIFLIENNRNQDKNNPSPENAHKVISKYILQYDSHYCKVIEFETTDGVKCITVLYGVSGSSLSCNWVQ
jgi:hypothetical protein